MESTLPSLNIEHNPSEETVPLFLPLTSANTTHKQNLEIFSLIWCDSDVENVYQSRATQEQLLDLISFQRTFKSIDECEQYIHKETTIADKIILISSGKFGQDLLSHVHHLPQINSVYIYCLHKNNHQTLLANFLKVRCIENNASILVAQIIKDHQVESILDKNTIPMTFFNNSNERSHKNLQKENGNFIWFQLFIETLLRMRTIDVANSLDEFVNLCNEQYAGNDRQLNKIQNFRQNYEPDHCLWWYSKEVFLYRILNKALRMSDMDTLYTLRFFIRDLYRELNENKCVSSGKSTVLELYRGQVLSCEELETIQSSIGQYISMNSFFSTTSRHAMALLMAQSNISCSEQLKPVIFHIKADTKLLHAKPYADITQFSNFAEEEAEVLFMLGSVFRFRKVYFQDDDKVHVIDLELCGEDENELREVYSGMKKTIGEETDIKVLGNVLKDMGQYERALQCYEKVLKLVEPNDQIVPKCYYSIGQVMQLQGQYEKSLLNFDKVLEFEAINPFEDSIIVGLTHNYMGVAYQYGALRHDYTAALAHYKRALKIHLDVKGRLYAPTAYVYNNLATLYRVLGDYDKSLEYHHICLDIKNELYPEYFNPTIAASINNIGVVYHLKKDYQLALEYYSKALEIRLKVLPENHQDQAVSFTNLGQIHEALGEYQLALEYAQKALAIYQLIFKNNHHYILMVKEQIENLQQKLNEVDLPGIS